MPDGRQPTPDKWALLRAVEAARVPLGLKSTTLNLLRAMLSFMRTDVISTQSSDAHICFASNAALAERTHVSIQTVERHVARLVSLGLVNRHASNNNKRWARRDRTGRVALATGLSLLPLLERYSDHIAKGEAQAAFQDRLAELRDRCVLALGRLRKQLGEASEICLHAARILRRKPDETELRDLLARLHEDNPLKNEEEAVKMRGSDTPIEGHKDSSIDPEVKGQGADNSEKMQTAFPALCAELRSARTHAECRDRMEHLALGLGLGQAWKKVTSLGPTTAFMVLGYILERQGRVRNPKHYALGLYRKLREGEIGHEDFLISPRAPNWRQSRQPAAQILTESVIGRRV